MFISVLYNDNGQIIAAAPACEVTAFAAMAFAAMASEENGSGSEFWIEHLNLPASNQAIGETGVHQVTDASLVEALLNLKYAPETLTTVQRQWELFLHSNLRSKTSRFPVGRKPGSKVVMPKAA